MKPTRRLVVSPRLAERFVMGAAAEVLRPARRQRPAPPGCSMERLGLAKKVLLERAVPEERPAPALALVGQ